MRGGSKRKNYRGVDWLDGVWTNIPNLDTCRPTSVNQYLWTVRMPCCSDDQYELSQWTGFLTTIGDIAKFEVKISR